MHRLLLALAIMAAVLSAAPAQAQVITSPPRGSALRAEVLDALRPAVERDTGGPVIFVVGTLHVMGEWAYVSADPKRKDGRPIDWRQTRFRRDFEADMFSGLVLALLRNEGGRWTIAEYVVGPTDVTWLEWVAKHKLPETLFSGR